MPAVHRETLKFELASHEVIDLLVGHRIYTDPPRVVVRELLQNAVDACRLRRALAGPGYAPRIRVAWQPGWLTVEDNGVGMTEAIVRGYFLRVGRSYYSSDDFRATYGDVAFAPIARFGIGALSAFLVAERLHVVTRHWQPGAEPLRLEIEGLHSTIAVAPALADTPVGTRLDLALRPGVAYPDLVAVVRDVARHLEMPVEVEVEGAVTVIPADDGAAYRRDLAEPLHYAVRDPARRHQVRTRRVALTGPGLEGFVEYLYLEAPGRLRRPLAAEDRALVDLYDDLAPRAVSLDGIYVNDQLPAFLAGPGVAYDVNLRSRPLGVGLCLDRQRFVEDEPYRRLVAHLDRVLAQDLVALVQGARLTPVQMAESLAALVDVRRLQQHTAATGSTAAWEVFAALPIFPLRLGGQRRWVPWDQVLAHPEVARVPVGEERVAFPESAAHLVDDFWWDRHFRLCQRLPQSLPFYTSLDAHPLAGAFLARGYAPDRVVVDAGAGVSYPVLRRGAPAPPRLAGAPVLPLVSPAGEPLPHLAATYLPGGWALNALHPAVQAALAAAPGSGQRLRAERDWRDRLRQLGPLPAAAAAQAAGVAVPDHDTAEWWEAAFAGWVQAGGGG